MNKGFLTTNVGKQMRLLPTPYHSEAGRHERRDDDWEFAGYEGSTVTLLHVPSGAIAVLGDDNFIEFRSDVNRGDNFGFLILKAQLFVADEVVTVQPLVHPREVISPANTTLVGEAFLETALACHVWKNDYLNLRGWDSIEAARVEGDLWDKMQATIPAMSDQAYQRYLPLFAESVPRVQARFDRVIQLFGRVIPDDFQAELVRHHRQLSVECASYLQLRLFNRAEHALPRAVSNVMFQGRFQGVIRVLSLVDREVERRRGALRANG